MLPVAIGRNRTAGKLPEFSSGSAPLAYALPGLLGGAADAPAGAHRELMGAAVGAAGVFRRKFQTAADGGLVVALPTGGGLLGRERPGELPAVPGQHLGADAVDFVRFWAFCENDSGFFGRHDGTTLPNMILARQLFPVYIHHTTLPVRGQHLSGSDFYGHNYQKAASKG